jgi:hypothetical protein
MSTEMTEITTPVMMTKQEAQEKDAQIIQLSGQYIDIVGPIALEMREREGWRALGFKNWTDYCQHVDGQISAVNVMRLAQKAEVEKNVHVRLPMRHALALARLKSPEAQREVFKEVMDNYETPVERNYLAYVDKWLKKHDPHGKRADRREDKTSWTKGDLEDDGELAEALGRIEKVYGHGDRKSIQEGTIGLSRKDIIALSAFHPNKIKEVHYLIMANHWDVPTAMRFINTTPDGKTTIHELQNHCLGTTGFYYACSVEGFDIAIKACSAIASKIKGQANDRS